SRSPSSGQQLSSHRKNTTELAILKGAQRCCTARCKTSLAPMSLIWDGSGLVLPAITHPFRPSRMSDHAIVYQHRSTLVPLGPARRGGPQDVRDADLLR